MKNINLNQTIVADPAICHGTPTFKGTRIMVWQVLELLGSGEQSKDIYRAFPGLPENAVEAALHYAAQKAKRTSYAPFKTGKHSPVLVFAG